MLSLAKIGPDQTSDLIGCWNAGSENVIVIARSSREVLETNPP